MKKVAIAMLLSAISAPAFAGDSGFYGALDVQTWSLSNLSTLATGASNPSTGFRIGGGYHFTQNWGVEVDYAQSGNGDTGIPGVSYKADSAQAVAVGTYPINNMFDVYGKLGVAANKISASGGGATCTNCSKTSFMYGVGGQYNINNSIGIRLEYDGLGDVTNGPVGPQISATNVSLGVVYNF